MTSNGGRVKSALADLQIVVERHSEVLVTNHALPFQILLGASIVGHVLSLSSTLFSFLSLTSHQLYSVELWRLGTSPFVGRNLLEFALTVACLHFGCTLVRQNNTNNQLLRIFAIVQLITPLCVSVVAFFAYAIVGHTDLLFAEPLTGMLPVDVAVMVLVKQFLPDSIVLTTPIGRLKYTHLPFTLVSLTALSSLLKLSHWVATVEAVIGMQVAWTYLRFMQPHATDAIFGDNSEHFTWASLFPAKTRPFMALIGTAAYRSLVRIGAIRRTVRTVDINQMQSVNVMLANFEDPVRDAERRRKLALQALNESLAKMRENETEWPSDEEESAPSTERAEKSEKEASKPEEPSTSIA